MHNIGHTSEQNIFDPEHLSTTLKTERLYSIQLGDCAIINSQMARRRQERVVEYLYIFSGPSTRYTDGNYKRYKPQKHSL